MRWAGRRIVVAMVLFAVLAAAATWLTILNESRWDGPAQAIDGDSIRMFGEELRLKGIDAPELGQLCHREGRPWRCGSAAKAALEKETRGVITCVGRSRDRYGRALVTCRAGGADIAAALARAGMAVAYGGYEREEAEARDARRGVWASTFERPEDWRRAHPRAGAGP